MTKKLTIKHNQSLLDLSVQSFGTMEALMESAFLNNLSVTDELIEGEVLELPEFNKGQTEIIDYYNKRQIKPVTALTDADFALIEIESCNLCNCFK